MVQLKATPTQRGQTLLIGSDPINTVWHRARFSGACVAPGGPEEGGGGLPPPEEPVALYAALGMPVRMLSLLL